MVRGKSVDILSTLFLERGYMGGYPLWTLGHFEGKSVPQFISLKGGEKNG